MQYLQSQPFSVGLGSRRFQEGWDRIFSKRNAEPPVESAPTIEPAAESEPEPERLEVADTERIPDTLRTPVSEHVRNS